jgi:hypothetical protein
MWKTSFRGTSYEVKYHYRDLIKHAEELLQDPLLAQHSHFHAEEKYLHCGEQVKRFYDEPWSGQEWWKAEVRSWLSYALTYSTHI